MARYAGKEWKKEELLSYIGDPAQVAGAKVSRLCDGKSDGVKSVDVNTGSGLSFQVLPGRGMDIPEMYFNGKALHFASGTGITSPAYYEEPGLGWLRSFYVGTLTTCGITSAGAPGEDEGTAFGLHGRVANAGAENLSVSQGWEGEEYNIQLRGTMRECMAMFENVSLTRTISTSLGRKGFTIFDRVINHGFEEQPLMMLYHLNFGFPLLGPSSSILCASKKSVERDTGKEVGDGEYNKIPAPVQGIAERVFFHTPVPRDDGTATAAVVNRDIGDGSPLGARIVYRPSELPKFNHWMINRKGFYTTGLEPGNISPLGRGVLRKNGELPFIGGQEEKTFTIDMEIADSLAVIDEWEAEYKRQKQAV